MSQSPASRRSVNPAQRRKTSILAAFAVAALLLVFPVTSGASPTTVGMGTAGDYSALAHTTITNTGDSVLHGSLGLHPGTSVTGFPPGQVLGDTNIDNAAAEQAKSDLNTAYLDAESRIRPAENTLAELQGLTLTAGVYGSASSLLLDGTLILDGQGDPNSVFIFQAGSTLTAETNSTVSLIGNAQACNVFWQVGSSATVGVGSSFVGTIMALESVTVNTGATIEGRALARTAAVTLDTNTIFQPGCDLTTDDDTTTTTAADDDDADLPDTGAGLALAFLIGGLALLVAGGGMMAVAKRRRADLR